MSTDPVVTQVDPAHERAMQADLAAWRRRRDPAAVRAALARLACWPARTS